MKFDKESYKRALNRIGNQEELKKKIVCTNQKYKADILSGREPESDMIGWNASNAYYDSEMLRIMGKKKFMRLLVMLAVGIVLAVVLGVVTEKDIYLRMYGETVTAYYVDDVTSYFDPCYRYYWSEADYPEEYEYTQHEDLSLWGHGVTYSAYSVFYEKNGDTMTLYFLKNKGEKREKLRPAINHWLLCGGYLVVLIYIGFCIRGLVRNAKERKQLD